MMESFEPLLHVLRGVLEDLGQPDDTTFNEDFHLQSWAQIEYGLRGNFDDTDDLEKIHPSPTAGVPAQLRLAWCIQRSTILQRMTTFRNRRDSRDSCEMTDRELRDRMVELSRSGSKERNIVSWLDQTYTTHKQDKEFREQSSKLLRRANTRNRSIPRLKRSGSLPHRRPTSQRSTSPSQQLRVALQKKWTDTKIADTHLAPPSRSLGEQTLNLALSTPNLRDWSHPSETSKAGKEEQDPLIHVTGLEREVIAGFSQQVGQGGINIDDRVSPGAISPKQWENDYLDARSSGASDADHEEGVPLSAFSRKKSLNRSHKSSLKTPTPHHLNGNLRASSSSSLLPNRDRESVSETETDEHRSRHSLESISSAHPDETALKASRSRLNMSFRKIMKQQAETVYEPSDECHEFVNASLNEWDLDFFKLTAMSECHPLAVVGLKVFHQRNLIETLKLDETVLLRFFTTIENKYGRYPTIPYHNNSHGADVVHSVHFMLDQAEGFTPHEIFATLIAAAIHDVDHPGRTNNFLVKTSHKLAILYNDRSVLENHHIATGFDVIFNTEGCNILENFKPEEQKHIRKLIIDMVMSTDMIKHTKFLGEFRALLERAKETTEGLNVPPCHFMCTSDDVDDRALVLCNIVHTADLGGSAKPWKLCQEWTSRILTEFFEEGDEERKLDLEIGALNDRHTVVVPKAQVGYINFIAKPLWRAWNDFISLDRECIQTRHLNANLSIWEAKTEQLLSDGPATPSADSGAVSAQSSPRNEASRTASLSEIDMSKVTRTTPKRLKSLPRSLLRNPSRSLSQSSSRSGSPSIPEGQAPADDESDGDKTSTTNSVRTRERMESYV